ncbi:MAG: Plasmid stabilization system [Candidatus Peregrinibacteria bacterium GW2011_GWA2_47_7]|nr:MAG: Plasmid stabilization system [Candidatus Peregrinibacteria bacterium GW2011_GWA2_47_7]
MKIKEIFYSSHFERAFKKLPSAVKKRATAKEKIFRKDCFDECLKTHKLHGELNAFWSFSVDYSYRILFEFHGNASVIFIDIGPHSIYQ